MSYPESLSDSKDIQDLLFRKEYAQLHLNNDILKNFKSRDQQTIKDILDTNIFNINELSLDPIILKENLLVLHSHQQFVSNLMNPDTAYIRLLLKHDTGTGKTIAAICMAMLFIVYYQLQHTLTEISGYSHTPMMYIIGFSKQIFQKELLRRPEFGFITKEEIIEYKRLRYLADVGSQNDKDIFSEYESRIKKRLSKKSRGGFFKFYGYKEFFNRLFIFNENISRPESGPEQDDEPILTEDQIINGLKTGKISLNFELIDSFANSFIICDEFHNAYNSSEINNYGIAIRMLLNIFDVPDIMNKIVNLQGNTLQNIDRIKLLKNSFLRVLFMTATPINNSPTEIIDLLNLLVPLSTLPGNKKLEKEDFFEDHRNLKKGALEKIQKLIRGYVSFLRDDNPKYFPEKKIEGEEIVIPEYLLKDRVSLYKGKTIPYFKFIRCEMSELHQKTYDAVYKGTLPPDGQSLIDIVLPNPGLLEEEKNIGLFRTKDIKYNLLNATQLWRDKNQIYLEKTSNGNYIITGEFMKRENLPKYSTKYTKMLDDIVDNLRNDKGKIIISHQYVKMSGVLFIQEVLRKNGLIDEYTGASDDTLCSKCGYTRYEHSAKSKNTNVTKKPHEFLPARFITYHGEIDKNTLDKSLEKYKNLENSDGYYFRILIGSKIINEGIDFNAVRNVWIMVAPANVATAIQIIGRSVRSGSHLMLDVSKRNVKIRIYVSSMSGRNKNKILSYEEKKYFEKTQDYVVIQQIEKVFNENAIDAVIHRDIIMPPGYKNNVDELGALYFEPSGIFGKKWIDISEHKSVIKMNDLNLDTFRIYHSDKEISIMLYIIKRLFIEQSTVWKYDDLWEMVKSPPFDLHVNPKLFLEEDFIIALSILSETQNSNIIDTYQITTAYNDMKDKIFGKNIHYDISRLFDHLDKRIMFNNKECKILYINGYYMLIPIIDLVQNLERDVDNIYSDKTSQTYLGISSINLSGIPDIDIDNWYRQSEDIENTNFRITKYLKTSNISYNQMKYKFYNQFKDYTIEELPTSVEIYDLDFHSKLAEDSIRYAFNILTNTDMPFSELHEFYFKMLYFYDRLDLILFADHLENTKLYDNYKDYITHANIKINVYEKNKKDTKNKKDKNKKDKSKKKEILMEDHKYNPFLMSSIIKSSQERTFNINRLNNFIGKRDFTGKKHPKLEDMNISKQINIVRKKINKVFSNMLPVGHFLNTSMENSGVLAVPKIYMPDLDPDINDGRPINTKSYPWVRAFEFVQYHEPVNNIENDIIIGYYEKNISGIDIKFKLRLPIHKITVYEDTRMIERGSSCNTRKKEELIKIAQDLEIDIEKITKDEFSIKIICNEIKLELMKREMKERRKLHHLDDKTKKDYKRIRWFYLMYEPQLEV